MRLRVLAQINKTVNHKYSKGQDRQNEVREYIIILMSVRIKQQYTRQQSR